MKEELHQGDILKIEHIKKPVLVVSKDFFNQTHEIIGCPIFEKGEAEHEEMGLHRLRLHS